MRDRMIGKIIGIVFLLVVVYFAWNFTSGELNFLGSNYDNMSNTELKSIATDLNYRELNRNYDYNKGKIIHVAGIINHDKDGKPKDILLCTATGPMASKWPSMGDACSAIFITTDNGNFLADDRVSGFVEVKGMKSINYHAKIKMDLPFVRDINLSCTN